MARNKLFKPINLVIGLSSLLLALAILALILGAIFESTALYKTGIYLFIACLIAALLPLVSLIVYQCCDKWLHRK